MTLHGRSDWMPDQSGAMRRCVLTGPCLAGHTHIGAPWDLALHTFDRFGNARATGLEDVTVAGACPEGTQVQKASETDRGNGCYSIAFQPDREGRWLITPRCALGSNGCTTSMSASFLTPGNAAYLAPPQGLSVISGAFAEP